MHCSDSHSDNLEQTTAWNKQHERQQPRAQLVANYLPNDSILTRTLTATEAASQQLQQQQLQQRNRQEKTKKKKNEAPKNNIYKRLMNYALGASLIASVLNTLLLSFIVKSIQLSDKGLFDGRLSFYDELRGIASIDIAATGKSLLADCIESSRLRLIAKQRVGNSVDSVSRPMLADNVAQQILLSTSANSQALQRPAATATTNSSNSKPNYISVNGRANEKLEITTKSFALHLINSDTNRFHSSSSSKSSTKAQEANTKSDTNQSDTFMRKQKLTPASSKSGTQSIQQQQQQQQHSSSSRSGLLVNFNGERQSISLPKLSTLLDDNLHPARSNSLLVNERLISDQISGSLEENLDLQARDGALECSATETMRLVSKWSNLRLVAGETFRMGAPIIALAGNGLYLQFANGNNNNNNINYRQQQVARMQQPPTEQHEGDSFSSLLASEPFSPTEPKLRAYNLALVDGHLVAAAYAST